MRLLCFAAVVVLVVSGSCLQAAPEAMYFVQDDFWQIFGEQGNPGSAGTQIGADGRLVLWDVDQVAGWWTLSAVTTAGAFDNGSGQWQTNYEQGTVTVTDSRTGGNVLWQGSVVSLYTLVNMDQSPFDATAYDRPDYENQPETFLSVGFGEFARTGGSWLDPGLVLDWMGTYNWNFNGATPGESSEMYGNIQGKLVVVPEPASFVSLLLLTGGLAGRCRRKS